MENGNIPEDKQKQIHRLLHDLMNPLTVIMGYAQLMTNRDDLPVDVLKQAQDIYEQAIEVSHIAEKIKKTVLSGNSGPSGSVLVLDTQGSVFNTIQGFNFNNVACYRAKDLAEAVDFVHLNPVRTVVVNLDSLALDDVLVQLNTARPGIPLVLINSDKNKTEDLLSTGYPVLVPPLEESAVLEQLKAMPDPAGDD